jgi:hypothetical protein
MGVALMGVRVIALAASSWRLNYPVLHVQQTGIKI